MLSRPFDELNDVEVLRMSGRDGVPGFISAEIETFRGTLDYGIEPFIIMYQNVTLADS